MSNSALITYTDTSTYKWNPRNQAISRITIHHAASVMTLEDFSALIRVGGDISWNYAIDNTGRIGMYVTEDHRSWCSSSPDNDHRAVTIMVSNSATTDDWPVSDAAYNSTLKLVADVCERNNITKLTYTGRLEGSNLTLHKWFTSTLCPGPFLQGKMNDIVKQVNNKLQTGSFSGSSSSGSGSSSPGSSSSGSSGSSSSSDLDENQTNQDTAYSFHYTGSLITKDQINYDYLDPYIITIGRNTGKLDYKGLKEYGVVGELIEAGRLYDDVHQEVYFRNPKLEQQCQEASDQDLPFGLYMDARARSVQEAEKELYQLSFCIREYPPALGMWFHLQLIMSVETNNKIIDRYYKEMVRLGLKDHIGFYVTRDELKQITWEDYYEDWYLWLVDYVQNIDELDQLMTPQFFVLGSD